MKVLPFTSEQLSIFLNGWNSGWDEKPEELVRQCPDLIYQDQQGHWRIQKKKNKAQEILNDGTALLLRYNISQLCEKMNIHPIVLGFDQPLNLSSTRPPYLGVSIPLECDILLDAKSYPQPLLESFQRKMVNLTKKILGLRQSDLELTINVSLLDIQELGHQERLHRLTDILYANTPYFQKGIRSIQTIKEEPQLVHAWRSKPLHKALLKAAAAGTLAHKGELYLRWLDSKKFPDKVTPIDEKEMEKHWPGAVKFFQMWSSMGIEERDTLKHVLRQLKPENATVPDVQIDNDLFSN